MSPDGDQQYCSDGLAEELLNLLARIPQPSVAARTSCFAFKDTPIYAVLARLAMYVTEDLLEAAAKFERALELAAAGPDVLFDSATLSQDLGRMDEAIALKEVAVDRDPINPRRHYNFGNACLFGRRHATAVNACRTAFASSPSLLGAHYRVGRALLVMGSPRRRSWRRRRRRRCARRGYWSNGRPCCTPRADAALAELAKKYGTDAACNIADVYAFRGEADEAFRWLKQAVRYGDAGRSEIAVTAEFGSLEEDRRRAPLLERLGKSPEPNAAIRFEVPRRE